MPRPRSRGLLLQLVTLPNYEAFESKRPQVNVGRCHIVVTSHA